MESRNEPICVVIVDDQSHDDTVRQLLGDAWPVHLVHWHGRAYLKAIHNLRPQVIIVVEAAEQVAQDEAALICCLINHPIPTVMSLGLDTAQLVLQQLGPGTVARMASLNALTLF
ncbi:MAG TPA: glycosyltransferase [Ktedonobacterales bacterium]|jgi:hypothetical protein|nr:glycosyltransferase [Ktedonobacterales bacterium]